MIPASGVQPDNAPQRILQSQPFDSPENPAYIELHAIDNHRVPGPNAGDLLQKVRYLPEWVKN